MSPIIHLQHSRMGCPLSSASNQMIQPPQNRYQRLEILGSGTHGKVYEVLDNVSGLKYAQKTISEFFPGIQIEDLKDFASSRSEKLNNLRHKNLVKYQTMYIRDKQLAVVMEMSMNGTLQDCIKQKGRIPEAIVSVYTRQILEALLQLHSLELFHNDLKPSNVLISTNQTIKLSDFCIADAFDPRLRTERLNKVKSDHFKWNNIPYMAPEVVKNLGVSQFSDVWSLGLIVVFMLIGKTPWTELGSQDQAFKKVSRSSIPPLPFGITVSCQHFLESCLSVIPSQRSKIEELLDHPFITGAKTYTLNEVHLQKSQKIDQVQQEIKSIKRIHNKLEEKGPSALKQPTQELQIFLEESPVSQHRRQRLLTEGNCMEVQKMSKVSSKKRRKNISFHLGTEEEFEQNSGHIVTLNNKKVKLRPSLYRNQRVQALSTDETQWTSPERIKVQAAKIRRQQQADKIQKYQASLGIFSGFDYYYEETAIPEARLRIHTENTSQDDKEFFKKPLKLLKKKLKQKRQESLYESKLSNQTRKYSVAEEVEKLYQSRLQNKQAGSSSIVVKPKHEDLIIDTQVAKAQRNRYQQVRRLSEQKRDERRIKWQIQLLKGKQILMQNPPFSAYLI